MQHLANNLPDSFTDLKGVTKSLNPARNAPERVEVPIKTTQLPVPKKRGSSTASDLDPASSKQHRKSRRKTLESVNASQLNVDKHPVDGQPPQPSSSVHILVGTSEHPDSHILGNHEESSRVQEISTNYIDSGESFERKSTIFDTYFSATIANTLLNDHDPRTIVECERCSDWPQWKDAIQAELASLNKRKVFTEAIRTPPNVFPVGFKWVFIRKRNENNEVVRYKARLVAQGFMQRPGIDFNETYSPVMSGVTFRYLISLAVQNHLSMQLMDVVTAYLYGSLDSDIYMKVPDGISVPNASANRNMYCVKPNKSLYGLKQSGRMWYNQLSEFLS